MSKVHGTHILKCHNETSLLVQMFFALLCLLDSFVFKNEARRMVQVEIVFRGLEVNVLCSIENLNTLILYVTLTWQSTGPRNPT